MSERPRRLKWAPPETPPPRRPYRDTAVFYAVLALVIVAVAWVTGGAIMRAIAIAVGFFLVATAWSFWQWRERLRRSAAEDAARRSGSEEVRP
jgi:Flp pilus assembly protein TadB